MLNVVHLFHLPIHSYLMCSVSLLPCNIIYYRLCDVSLVVRYAILSLDPGMRSMLSANLNSRPLTAIVPMKLSNACVLVCSKKTSGLETRYNFSEL